MFRRDIYLLSRSEEFHLDPGQEASININLKKAPPLPCTKLYGQVISINCANIQGATVKILDRNFHPVSHTETDEKGTFSFINTLIPGDYKILVSAENYLVSESNLISLRPFVPSYTKIKLSPDRNAAKSVVYGTVQNRENIPLPNAQVYIFSHDNKTCPINVATTDADGEYLITGLTPGKYVLSASFFGYTLPKKINIEIFAKEYFCADLYLYRTNSVTNGTISGIVRYKGYPSPYAFAALYREGNDGYRLIQVKETNSEGAYLFSGLKDGKYIVKAKPD